MGAGLGCNYPTREVIAKAVRVFNKWAQVIYILSLKSGQKRV